MRVLGPVLQATLQDLELREVQEVQGHGAPLYCQGVFDAITVGEVSVLVDSWRTWFNSTGPVPLDQNQTVFVFRGGVYWTVSSDGGVSGPLPLLQRWPRLPTAVQAAAFSPLDFKWYFFKGAGPRPLGLWARG